jgi:hypothetical protein
MKFNKLSKFIASVMTAVCLLVPTITTTATTSTYAATTVTNQTVKLDSFNYSAIAYNHNGGPTVYGYTATILVDNMTYDKTIVLHYQDANSNGWIDSQKASYVSTRSDGKEVWTVSGYFYGSIEFAINYKEVNAWDNNNYMNYIY